MSKYKNIFSYQIFFILFYMAGILFLFFYGNPINKEYGCKMDGYVEFMYPLKYTIVILLPMIWNVFVNFRNDFSLLVVTRKQSWKKIFIEQEKKCIFYAILFASIIFLWISLLCYSFPFCNWNNINSLYFFHAGTIADYSAWEMFFYIWIICIIRNYIIQHILLFFLWVKDSLLCGTLAVFLISGIEIGGKRSCLLLRLFSVDYSMWQDMRQKGKMLLGLLVWMIVGILLFLKAIKEKELLGDEKV